MAVKLLLKNVSTVDILDETVKYSDITKEQFVTLAAPYVKERSIDELEHIYEVLRTRIEETYEKYRAYDRNGVNRLKSSIGVYDLLFMLNSYLLETDKDEVRCRYQNMLEWRQLTIKISEDTFTTAFCASEDIKRGIHRQFFDWATVIKHNNFTLNKLLQREMSDNHFHLWASSPYFNVSWISMMNNIDSPLITNAYAKLKEHKQNINMAYHDGYRESTIEIKHLQAALIRVFLYSCVFEKKLHLDEYVIRTETLSQEELEKALKPEVLERIKTLELPTEKGLEDITEKQRFDRWIENLKEDNETDRCLRYFLQCLKEREYHIGSERKFYKSFYDMIFQRALMNLEDMECIMRPEIYDKWFVQCTEETVQMWLRDEMTLQAHRQKLQDVVNAIKDYSGDDRDYVLEEVYQNEEAQNSVRWELCGERYLLYRIFKMIYSFPRTDYRIRANWFYAYLVLKESIRGELVQSNEQYGFRNFQIYDRRKSLFLSEGDSGRILRLAITDTLSEPYIKNLEVRIVPRRSCEANVDYIRMIDWQCSNRDVKNPDLERYYYVYHFTKQEDDDSSFRSDHISRHERKRNEVRQQAIAISKMRDNYPNEAKRVLGIDGCSKEIGCRPEVFSQAFRYLKDDNKIGIRGYEENSEIPRLRATFHVGEDFLDIVDGLRAIDEAIHFLGLEQGDRLGHALALGKKPKKYYAEKKNRVNLTKQDYLDNMAWICHKITEYELEEELSDFHSFALGQFDRFFSEIYGQIAEQHNYNIHTYYMSWCLRGDDPECYVTGKYVSPSEWWNIPQKDDSYDHYAVNALFPEDYYWRHIEAASYLYYVYHYNSAIKMKGKESVEIVYPHYWADGVELIQKAMQKDVARKGIAIETNPSSNYMISRLAEYEEHPIINWYNHGLEQREAVIEECPQLSVSINTDDKGCFSTSLVNEFSLMACALENYQENGSYKYKQTMVYNWLDEVREMGNLQSFRENIRK